MTEDSPFRWILLAMLLSSLAISGYHRWQARREEAIPRLREAPLLILLRLAVALPLAAALALYLVHPPWMAWARLPLSAEFRWFGAGLGAAAVPSVYWVVRSLGRNISETVLTKESHELVTDGPYRRVRHPLYTAGLLLLAAASLLSANAFVGAMTLLAVVGIRTVVIPREEAALIETFGRRYLEYRRRTGALLPSLGRDPLPGQAGPETEG